MAANINKYDMNILCMRFVTIFKVEMYNSKLFYQKFFEDTSPLKGHWSLSFVPLVTSFLGFTSGAPPANLLMVIQNSLKYCPAKTSFTINNAPFNLHSPHLFLFILTQNNNVFTGIIYECPTSASFVDKFFDGNPSPLSANQILSTENNTNCFLFLRDKKRDWTDARLA